MKIDLNILIVEDSAQASILVKKNIEDSIKGKDGSFMPWVHQWIESQRTKLRLKDFNVECSVYALHSSQLEALVAPCCKKDGAILENVVTEICNTHRRPSVVILDLALTEPETVRIANAGGRYPSKPPEETKEALGELTGFRLIDKFIKKQCVVITTSFASNPLVEKLCLEQGAADFVLKPYTSDEMAKVMDF